MQTLWIVVISIVFAAQQAPASDPAPVCRPESKCEEYQRPDNSKRFFKVNETKLSIDGNIRQLVLECLSEPGLLDVSSLPQYSAPRAFAEVYVSGCELGLASVGDVLRALGARAEGKLELERLHEPLRARHLAGLRLSKLNLATLSPYRTKLEDDFFSALGNDSSLVSLWTSGVEYDAPPSGLEKWTSTNAAIERLPRGVLSTLKELYLIEPLLRDLSALEEAVSLQNLSVTAAGSGRLPRLPALRTLWVQDWRGLDAAPLDCAQLESLAVVAAPLRPAADWLAGCGRLRELQLLQTPLQELPRELLRQTRALTDLTIRGAHLTSEQLPDDLLETNTELTKINLSHNELTSVPSASFFRRLEKLSELDLSWNRLAAPAQWFPALAALQVLRLDHNPLGDFCPELGTDQVKTSQNSWLQQLTSLTTLSLRNTSAVRVCVDWLTLMPHLRTLGLEHNNMSELEYRSLHPVRSQPSELLLAGNPVSSVVYWEEDLERAAQVPANELQTQVRLNWKAALRCDCAMYRFALALQRFPSHVRAGPLVCGDGRALRSQPLEALWCGAACGACACRAVPARAQLEARCPRLPGNDTLRTDYQWVKNLSLAGLGMESFPAATLLPPGLTTLDLRNNSLGAAGEDGDGGAAELLRARPALRLLVAGNSVDCRCGHRQLLDSLLQYRERVLDFESLVCSDGVRALTAVCAAGGGRGLGAALGALGALGAAALVALAALVHPRTRAKIKMIMHTFGVRVPGAGGGAGAGGAGGAGWQYDAFIAFAEPDAAWVSEHLVPALESGPKPRRLCVHYRDWVVGELIPDQIARSVGAARRTVCVVSEAFARSAWARAELEAALARAAADGRPAPLLLLRAPPSPAALAAAPALAHHLAAATYLRPDDPRFLQRLLAAIPATTPPPTPPAQPAV